MLPAGVLPADPDGISGIHDIGEQWLEDFFVLVFDVRDAHIRSRVGRIEFALYLGDVDGKDEFASHQVDKHFFFEFTQVLHALGIVSSLVWFAELLQEIDYSELYARVEDWKMLFVHFSMSGFGKICSSSMRRV